MRSLLPLLRNRDGDPFVQMRRDMETLFDEFGTRLPSAFTTANTLLAPIMDVAETDTGLEVTAELPGVSEDAVNISIEDRMLVIKGEKKSETEDKKRHVYERSYGSFYRSLALPFAVDPDAVSAQIKDGVLTVSLPRPSDENGGVKRIAVAKA